MKYFTIDIESGRIVGATDYEPSVPDTVLVREVKDGELDLFMTSSTSYDSRTDSIIKDKITDVDELRSKMLAAGSKLLNTVAKSKGYIDLADAISFKDSLDEATKADAMAAIAAKDKMRSDILAFINEIYPGPFSISLEVAMSNIKTSW